MKEKVHDDSPSQCFVNIKTKMLLFVLIVLNMSFVTAQNEHANENATVDGGVISTTDNTTVCVGDGIPDLINVAVENASGRVKQWIITDDENNILKLPEGSPFDFEDAPPGVCRIWHLSYNGIKPLVDPFWHKHVKNLSDIKGRYSLSNYIEVTRQQKPTGGMLEGEPFEFCVGDGEADHIPEGAITLSGNMGTNSQWVVTNEDGSEILGLPPNSYTEVNFDGAPAGICLVWHLMYEDGLVGLEVGNNPADLMGCFDLSNAVTVIRRHTEGGTLTAGDDNTFEFCVGDGEADHIPEGAISLSGNEGTHSSWVVTNEDGSEILGLPPNSYSEVNFDEAPAGTCLVWHLSYEDDLTGLEVGNNPADLMGCFDLSNAVTVIRKHTEGGTLTAGDDNTFEFTVGDGTADNIPADAITLEGNIGTNSQWVVTNEDGTIILGLPENDYTEVDFDGAGAGTCLVWHLSYENGLVGLEPPSEGDHLVASLEGCFSLSNSITITRTAAASTSKFTLYPNPAKGTVNVGLSKFGSNDINLKVYSLQNTLLFDSRYNSKIDNTSISVRNYLSGIYIVSVTDNKTGNTVVKRLVVR
ncbi:T9SS type A sorting domain-containing protein [Snuella sedimenti]|uniref:T9SS type A sorting domain-containing protein n=1 Tax=Snuella sedimenti TaxID=2798802 RepID=A0A8J7LXI9_9FLAO|nr:T9SS type A sorting domain-containing protein [Snuella sedimenti]MBJ6366821.1 T9SS type A sorting domain-containing protein [Snuella sedimenti]